MLSSTTVRKIESKRIDIRTQGQENCREAAILTILASAEKLAPFLIFKAQEGKHNDCKI